MTALVCSIPISLAQILTNSTNSARCKPPRFWAPSLPAFPRAPGDALRVSGVRVVARPPDAPLTV